MMDKEDKKLFGYAKHYKFDNLEKLSEAEQALYETAVSQYLKDGITLTAENKKDLILEIQKNDLPTFEKLADEIMKQRD